MLEQLLAGIEGGQRGGAVAGEIEQADHALVCDLRQGLAPKQGLRHRQGRRGVARILQRPRLGLQAIGLALLALLALLREPGIELGRIGQAQRAQQFDGFAQVVRDAFGQCQHR